MTALRLVYDTTACEQLDAKQAARRADLLSRIWARIDKDAPGGCWYWTGCIARTGYGNQWWDGRVHLSHRLIYQFLVGRIPEGFEIDHLCYQRRCVNPEHLEPVTGAENLRREGARVTHCPQGHEYTPENTYRWGPRQHRTCRTCRAAQASLTVARRTRERAALKEAQRGTA